MVGLSVLCYHQIFKSVKLKIKYPIIVSDTFINANVAIDIFNDFGSSIPSSPLSLAAD